MKQARLSKNIPWSVEIRKSKTGNERDSQWIEGTTMSTKV